MDGLKFIIMVYGAIETISLGKRLLVIKNY